MRFNTNLQSDSKPQPNQKRKPAHEIDRSAAQNEAPENAECFALAARATNDAVRDWDVSSGRLDWPQGLDTFLGHKPSVIAQDIGFWQRHVHPDDRARIALGIREALVDAERWSGEYRFRRADGDYILLLERAIILRNVDGAAIRFVGSLMDITARRQLQDQMVRSQKMEAFGQLAGGVAHDFNNFLTTILGYSDLILATSSKGPVAKHVTEIRGAAGRAAALTGQLLAFSRKHPLDSRVLEVNTFVHNLERSILPLLGENISVECNLHRFKDGGHIKVDAEQLKQILLNLAVNARDAMPHGGQMTIATGALRIHNEPNAANPEELAAGDYITISVTDNGVGMSDEVKAHLFEPFFSTKHGVESSGLGLATSYGIIHQSGGRISVTSEVGSGTTVMLCLPKVAPPAPAGYKSPSAKNIPTGTETVLVLEDDIAVRHLSVRILRNLGYEVIEAANGDDAQRIIRQDSGRKIHLLLTDVVMPQMSGHHFADWLRKASPHTKVIFVSGYLDESLQLASRRDGAMFFLPKPFDTAQLALKVREALDTKG
ncbi:MAG: response regulator [Verrucomicrobiota bacterium]|nr:response regulator [Verrucomicrobiota bacterium]